MEVIKKCEMIMLESDDKDALKRLLDSFSRRKNEDSPIGLCSSAEPDPATYTTLLMTAAKYGRFESCKLLMSVFPKSLTVLDKRGWTALQNASYHGHIHVAMLIIESCPEFLYDKIIPLAIASANSGNQREVARQLQSFYNIDSARLSTKRKKCSNNGIEDGEISEDCLQFPYREASLLYMRIVDVLGKDSDQNLIGYSFPCLKSGTLDGKTTKDRDLSLGRSSKNDVSLADLSLSKFHAVIAYFEHKFGLLHTDI